MEAQPIQMSGSKTFIVSRCALMTNTAESAVSQG